MPHISKHKVDPKILQICESRLSQALSIPSLQSEILTNTEKIMLAKRLSIIFLLRQNYSKYGIMKLLKVSPSTVDRIQKQIWKGEYDQIIKSWESKAERTSIIDIIDSLLTLGGKLPRYNYSPSKWIPYNEWKKLQQK